MQVAKINEIYKTQMTKPIFPECVACAVLKTKTRTMRHAVKIDKMTNPNPVGKPDVKVKPKP